MAVRCHVLDCKHNNGGWCDRSGIEINENGVCVNYEPKYCSYVYGGGYTLRICTESKEVDAE